VRTARATAYKANKSAGPKLTPTIRHGSGMLWHSRHQRSNPFPNATKLFGNALVPRLLFRDLQGMWAFVQDLYRGFCLARLREMRKYDLSH
jgi:hypothetical protein